MTWNERLKARLPREEIPAFLADLQALVAALREDRPWQDLLTTRLRNEPDLVLGYLQPGAKRDEVADALG